MIVPKIAKLTFFKIFIIIISLNPSSTEVFGGTPDSVNSEEVVFDFINWTERVWVVVC